MNPTYQLDALHDNGYDLADPEVESRCKALVATRKLGHTWRIIRYAITFALGCSMLDDVREHNLVQDIEYIESTKTRELLQSSEPEQ